MKPIATLSTVILDCTDPAVLADFYGAATGWEVTYRDDDVIYLGDGPIKLGFQRVAGYQAPSWPDDAKQAHFDFGVADVSVAVKELVGIGATLPDHQPGGDNWTVLVDPAGHLFCISAG